MRPRINHLSRDTVYIDIKLITLACDRDSNTPSNRHISLGHCTGEGGKGEVHPNR